MLQASQALRSLVFGSIRELDIQTYHSYFTDSGHGHDSRLVKFAAVKVQYIHALRGTLN